MNLNGLNLTAGIKVRKIINRIRNSIDMNPKVPIDLKVTFFTIAREGDSKTFNTYAKPMGVRFVSIANDGSEPQFCRVKCQ